MIVTDHRAVARTLALAAFAGIATVLPASARADVTCATAASCAGGSNLSSGLGVQGTSSGSGTGITATAGSGAAVFATSPHGYAAYGRSAAGPGIEGSSLESFGVFGKTYASASAGVLGYTLGNVSGIGVLGQSASGSGVLGTGALSLVATGTAACPAGGCLYNGTSYYSLAALAVTGSGGNAFEVDNPKGQPIFYVDDEGDLMFDGFWSCPNDIGEASDMSEICDTQATSTSAPITPLLRLNAAHNGAAGEPARVAVEGPAPDFGSSSAPGAAPYARRASVTETCAATVACENFTNTGPGAALEGDSTNGTGVEGVGENGIAGVSTAGYGLLGASVASTGLEALSNRSNGLIGKTQGDARSAGVVGYTAGGSSSSVGIAGQSANGIGVEGIGTRSFTGYGAVRVYGTNGGPLLIVRNSKGQDVFSVDDAGNVAMTGSSLICPKAYWFNPQAVGTFCQLSTFGPSDRRHQAMPSSAIGEITGDARLANGSYAVLLPHPIAHYTVTITPEGDSAGPLYVAEQNSRAFVVRERGGRSSTGFAYSIVAGM